jgi:hypothetical protein
VKVGAFPSDNLEAIAVILRYMSGGLDGDSKAVMWLNERLSMGGNSRKVRVEELHERKPDR